MKQRYERPVMYIEEFAVNRAIAGCGDTLDIPVVFDCMIGPNRDVENVMTTACTYKAGTTTCTTAYNPLYNSSRQGHSNETGGTWNDTAKTYTAPTGAIGLLYVCSANGGKSTSSWSEEGSILTHKSKSETTHSTDGGFHCQIAPIYGQKIEEVNLGS